MSDPVQVSDSAPQFEIRRMTVADIPSVMEIASGLEHALLYPRSAWLAVVDPKPALPRLALVAAAPSGELHGLAVASLLPPQSELETIAVAAGSQRRGIGRRLLESLIEELHLAAAHEVWLEVRASNAPALALYRSFGFSETGLRARYYVDPIEDAVLMTRQTG